MKASRGRYAEDARTRGLAAAGLCAFAATAIASAPAALIGSAISNSGSGLAYVEASGSIWSGKLSGVAWRGIDIGEVAFELDPAALLLGRISTRFSVKGGLGAARGIVSAGLSGEVAARSVTAELELDQIHGIKVLGSPLTGRATITKASMTVSSRGCRDAQGTVATDAAVALAARFQREGFPLEGPIRCENGTLVLPLAGEGGGVQVEALLRIDKSGRVATRAAIETQDSEIALALQTLGFRNDNGVWRQETSVRSQGGPG